MCAGHRLAHTSLSVGLLTGDYCLDEKEIFLVFNYLDFRIVVSTDRITSISLMDSDDCKLF